ncbi:MAG: SMP-30/gluconolactonase/LRE family protein [Pseudomonadota bacterium]
MQATLFREMSCHLGEGPLWDGTHLWFFDILGRTMYRLNDLGDTLESWEGERMASAAARTSGAGMLVATETDITVFDRESQSGDTICDLEADQPDTRSNDGRADRQGGFWIGTMGKSAAPGAGALYRFYKGELRCLRRGITIPNSICFSPEGKTAYFSDSALGIIYRWMLGPDGWPVGAPVPHYQFSSPDELPDGAVVDSSGALWVAVWGGARVQRITEQGEAREAVEVPVPQPSCPALTPDGRLFITTAREGMGPADLEAAPLSGSIFLAQVPVRALSEPKVLLQ